jgi:hypothetical protein
MNITMSSNSCPGRQPDLNNKHPRTHHNLLNEVTAIKMHKSFFNPIENKIIK